MTQHLRTVLVFGSILGAALAQAPAKKQVEVFGQKINYIEAGNPASPAVVLLHGLGGDTSNWAPNIAALAAQYHVLVPDQIGFGYSDKPQINYRIATLVDFLHGFLKKTGVAHATLVGNSLGGWTAMSYTLAYPDQVEKLVLVDSAGYSPARLHTPPPAREAILALNPSTVEGSKAVIAIIMYNKAMANDFMAEQMFTEHLRKGDSPTINAFIDSILRNEDVVDGKLAAIKAPTLVIWGKQDALTPLPGGEAMSQDIPGAKLVVLDKCGHVPQMECSSAFNQTLIKFLSGNEGTR